MSDFFWVWVYIMLQSFGCIYGLFLFRWIDIDINAIGIELLPSLMYTSALYDHYLRTISLAMVTRVQAVRLRVVRNLRLMARWS